jgi:HAD superfamily hydrolase (TIGR01509 family)
MIAPLVLSFDLDDTLWPVAPVIAAAEEVLLTWLRFRYPRAVHGHSIESMRTLRARIAEQFPDQCHDVTFLRQRALARQFGAAGYPESLADEALEVFLIERNRVDLYADVRPSLARLHSRYRLFAVSNGNADLARCGLADLFDGHITARAAGAAKPDARIFAQLLAKAGVQPSQVLHIGDDPLADVIGATRAGLSAVWLNRNAGAWPGGLPPPPRTIATLDELF